jgi:Uma2 family endonuclease
LTGARNAEISLQLSTWAKRDGRGIACDSSTGVALPNGARRSPDAAWILKSRVAQLDAASREKYWHLCPDFVVELKSTTDLPRILKDKMRENSSRRQPSYPRSDYSRRAGSEDPAPH